MEYWEYFRLEGPPFRPASPQGAVYFSPTHLEGLSTLEAGLSGNLNGLTLLTGEAGTGKTTLIYSLLQRDFKRVRIAHIDDPKLSFLEIMRVILTQLNLYSAGSTKLDYLKTLDHLLELHGNEERIAIVVDESQVLSDDVLEELRLLWNRGQRNDRCLLQVILVGQPELAERLKKPQLRQLNQRISSRGVLKPLNVRQGIMYVDCKLNEQGSSASTIFEPRALNLLLRHSDGIPRKINMLCHNAMLAGFHALERKVTVKTAKKVAEDYEESVAITGRKSLARRLLIPTLAVVAAALLFLGFRYQRHWRNWLANRLVASDTPEETLDPLEMVERAQAAKHLNTVAQPGLGGPQGSGAKPTAAAAPAPNLASQPPQLQASLTPAAMAPAAAKTGIAGPTTAPAMAAAAVQVASMQKPTRVPAAPVQRSQITIRAGDTLEKIAIRYFGSKSGIDVLVKANPQLTNINELNVGEIIYLPAGVTPSAWHDQAASAPPETNVDGSPE
jgi:general secretion pathway protein A